MRFELNPVNGQKCKTKSQGKPSQEAKSVATKEPKGEARRAHGIWPTKHANGGKLPHGRKLPSSLLSKCRNFRLNREGTSPEELSRTATSEPRSKVDGNKGAEEAICAISALPPQRTSSRCCSRSNVVTSDPTGREGCRRRQGRTTTKGTKKRAAERRSPSQPASSFVASDQNVVASDPKEREVVEREESNGSEGVERGERERMKCGSLSPRSFLPSIANDTAVVLRSLSFSARALGNTALSFPISHLSFADDVIIFSNGSIKMLKLLCLQPPQSVTNKIEKILKKKFWKGKGSNFKIIWASWKNCCGVREEGGLGCSALRGIAHAFSFKVWFTFQKNNNLWAKFMNAKYWKHPYTIPFKIGDSKIWKRLLRTLVIIRSRKPYQKVCNMIWHKSIPTTISTFVWRIMHKYVPTHEILQKRGFVLTSKCQCCSFAEDMHHVFITGPIASKVWMYFDNIFNVNYYYANIPIKELLELWFTPTRGHVINLISSLINWYIWMARNNSIYNNIGMNADIIIRNITDKVYKIFSVKLLKDKNFKGYCHIAKVFSINFTSNSNTFSPRIVCWIKPPVNFVKLNTDGSVKDNGWGCGGIIRDSYGNFIMAYATPLEKCSVILTELSAILHGLKLCSTLGFVNIWIEVDVMYMLFCLRDKVNKV
ncbi:hypothetical protein M5K25_020077 [Dendrobium thyrsiflorum]|uniref:RNase H type-1 domain-containing protein n=1 Tax=Dendrobium thyrsiflorum TaxID=117978 RepID=A0ABD0U9N0_DENTH